MKITMRTADTDVAMVTFSKIAPYELCVAFSVIN